MWISLLITYNLINDIVGVFLIISLINMGNGNINRVIIFIVVIFRLYIV